MPNESKTFPELSHLLAGTTMELPFVFASSLAGEIALGSKSTFRGYFSDNLV